MSEPTPENPENPQDGDFIKGQVRHQQISARVPDNVGRGVFSTGAIVLVGNNEFILDFVVRMAQPHQIAARVVLPHAVMPQLTGALRKNLDKYRQRYGDPPEMPKPPQPKEGDAPRPSIQDVYDDLKMADENLPGAYANAVMISHSPAEFCFDFITNFFPRSCVSSRIYVSAAQVPRLLEAIEHTYQEFQKRVTTARGNAAPPTQPLQSPQDNVESPYYPPKNLPPIDDDSQNDQIVGPYPHEDDDDSDHGSDAVDEADDNK